MSEWVSRGLRALLGLPPDTAGSGPASGNDFRNPIWGSDEDDDDDDELYHTPELDEQQGDINISIYTDPTQFHKVMTQQMQEMFKTFSGMFGDMSTWSLEEPFHSIADDPDPHAPIDGNIRDYYLKPGYRSSKSGKKEDVDLDGKISSHEIAGLLKKNELNMEPNAGPSTELRIPKIGGSFFQTIITQSVTKPDGTVETRRIVKDHLGNVEETVTTTERNGQDAGPDAFHHTDSIFRDFSSIWKMF